MRRTAALEPPNRTDGRRPGRTAVETSAPRPDPTTPPRPASRSWRAFERALAQVLAVLEDDHFLVLDRKRSGTLVQFGARGAAGLRIEAAPNASLPESAQLGRRELRLLRRLGWRRPTTKADPPPGQGIVPDESSGFFREYPHPAPFAAVAALAVETLREVYGVAHTGQLVYRAFESTGRALLLPTLRLNRAPRDPNRSDLEVLARRPKNQDELKSALLEAVTEATGLTDLEYDEHDTFSLAFEDLPVYFRVDEDEPVVYLMASLLRGLEPTPELLAAINEANNDQQFLNFTLLDGSVLGSTSVDCNPFIPDAVLRAMARLGKAAVEVSRALHHQFGGETPADAREGAEHGRKSGTGPTVN